MTPATRAALMLSAALLASLLAGCVSGGDEVLHRGPDATEAGEARSATTSTDVSNPVSQGFVQLDGDLEGREKLALEFPGDVPLPAGRVVSSTLVGLGGKQPWYFADIVCGSGIDSVDAMDWYLQRLREAGFYITDWELDGESRIVHRSRSYSVKIAATHSDGREVIACIGEDAALNTLFSIDVHCPAKED